MTPTDVSVSFPPPCHCRKSFAASPARSWTSWAIAVLHQLLQAPHRPQQVDCRNWRDSEMSRLPGVVLHAAAVNWGKGNKCFQPTLKMQLFYISSSSSSWIFYRAAVAKPLYLDYIMHDRDLCFVSHLYECKWRVLPRIACHLEACTFSRRWPTDAWSPLVFFPLRWRSLTVLGTKMVPFPYLMWGKVSNAWVIFLLKIPGWWSSGYSRVLAHALKHIDSSCGANLCCFCLPARQTRLARSFGGFVVGVLWLFLIDEFGCANPLI